MAKDDKTTDATAPTFSPSTSSTPSKFTFHPRYGDSKAIIVALGNGRTINLLGKATKRSITEVTGCCGNEKEVTYEVTIEGATQADYKVIYEREKKGRIKTVVPA